MLNHEIKSIIFPNFAQNFNEHSFRNFMVKRFFDILFSSFGLVVISPFFLIISILIKLNSSGPVFYRQERVGKNRILFSVLKFRTMFIDSDKRGLLTVGKRDPRVTTIGYFLRRFKMDELPQLINIFKGEMSFVGPRPEVEKYVNLYSDEQLKVLSIKPGLTDFASLEYFDENILLAKSSNPEQTYIQEVMPAKLELNKKFLQNQSLSLYFYLIFKTVLRVIGL